MQCVGSRILTVAILATMSWTTPAVTQQPVNPAAVPLSGVLDQSWAQLDGGQVIEASAGDTICERASSDDTDHGVSSRAELRYLCGRYHLNQGDTERAIEWLERSRRADSGRPGDRPNEAEQLYYLGLASELAGDSARALRVYADLIESFPADSRSVAVLPSIVSAGIDLESNRVRAASEAVENHNYSAAQSLLVAEIESRIGTAVEPQEPQFREALQHGLADGQRNLEEAAYQLGYLWYYWIRVENPNAASLLRAVADHGSRRRADALYYLARSYMRAEDYDSARQAWAEFDNTFPRDERTHEAAYYSGWLFLDREQFEEAIPGFETYLSEHPRGRRADRALWYLGWSHFRLANYTAARDVFSRIGSRGGYLLGAKGQYWAARCLQELEGPAAAEPEYRALAERYAFTYYGLLARQRLDEPLVPPREHSAPPSPLTVLSEVVTSSEELEQLNQLVTQSMPLRAMRYLDAADPENELGDDLDRVLVRQAAGQAHRAFSDMRSRNGSRLRDPPENERDILDWVRTFPRPFDTWMTESASAADVDPLLVWSHMQIESHYNPRMVSYADAMGLLQLIQKTGQRVAAALDETYTEGMLMEPALNIRFGCWYLGALVREFNGQLPLAITSYNSGAHSMHRWVIENSDLPFDQFVEEIPYDQSREYLKRVIGIYAHYLFLYADDDRLAATLERLLPETISPEVRGEIDY